MRMGAASEDVEFGNALSATKRLNKALADNLDGMVLPT
jgi:hypothetical protein